MLGAPYPLPLSPFSVPVAAVIMAPTFSYGEPAVSHNDELSLFMNEVADVRPIRSDNIHPHAAKSAPTEAQLGEELETLA